MININKINELKSLCIDINTRELDIDISEEIDNLIKKLEDYIMENTNTADKPKELKIDSDIISDFEKYKKYSDWSLRNIARVINEYFNFHTEIDNGMIDFEMGGCTYNVYLSRGYIVLEEADNSTIDNVWTVDDINEFVDLIKDLKEDN